MEITLAGGLTFNSIVMQSKLYCNAIRVDVNSLSIGYGRFCCISTCVFPQTCPDDLFFVVQTTADQISCTN